MKKLLLIILFPFFLFGQTQIGNDIGGELVGNNAGNIVSLSSDGSIIAIGSSYISEANQIHSTYGKSGNVRIYENSTGVWQQIGADINGEASGHNFTSSLSLSPDGSTVAIGYLSDDGNGSNSGHVQIYKNESGVWTQIGADIDGEASGDNSGASVSLNSDGSIVAIGAPNNDGNGSNSGHVRIYKNESGIWTQEGGDIDGEALGDKSGTSVSISSDGSIVAIGAPLNAKGGSFGNHGHVRIYKNESEVWTQIGSDIEGESSTDRLGSLVRLSSDGSTVAFNKNYSEVSIYKNVSEAWEQIGFNIGTAYQFAFSEESISLSSDGNIVAIGNPYKNPVGAGSGLVRVYENVVGVWTQIGTDINGEAAGDLSGYSVSLSSDGNMVAIGATSNSSNGILSGDVRIFENVAEVWTQVGGDINNGNLVGNRTGKTVCLSSDGNVLASGIPNDDENGSNSGQVRIYNNIGGIWTQIGESINGQAYDDFSGFSIDLNSDGSIVVIGSTYSDGKGLVNGQARVFENVGGVWTQIGADIYGNGYYYGYSVSLSADGGIVAIGSDLSNKVQIYKNESGVWTQIGAGIVGEALSDEFGYSIDLNSDGNIVAIGAPANEGNGFRSGHVRIYKNESDVWTQIGSDIDGEAVWDESGSSVSLSSDGSIVAIGAKWNKGNGRSSGHVRVYENESGVWTQIGADIDGKASKDYFGYSVSLNSDGSIIAIGATGGGSLTNSGYVQIYKNNDGVWTQIGTEIEGDVFRDQFGYSVSLSSDSSTLAIGAPYNDGIGIDTGQVRVYDLNTILSIKDNIENYFVIYPNPTSKTLHISINNSKLIKATIYNNLGQTMGSTKSTTINVEEFNSGIYFIEVLTEQGKSTKKIIIK